jgi:hypothetical protein
MAEKGSSAAKAAERVRAVLEAAEQSAADLRAEATQEIESQLKRAQVVTERLSSRADEIERALQGLADTVRDELSALKADLEELRAVGEGIGDVQEPVAEPSPAPPTPAPPTPEPAAAAADPAPPAEPEPAVEPEPPAEPEPVAELEPEAPPEPAHSPAAPVAQSGDGPEGARVIALNMALNGSSREDTARYLSENFDLDDPDALLDEVYARVGG